MTNFLNVTLSKVILLLFINEKTIIKITNYAIIHDEKSVCTNLVMFLNYKTLRENLE